MNVQKLWDNASTDEGLSAVNMPTQFDKPWSQHSEAFTLLQ